MFGKKCFLIDPFNPNRSIRQFAAMPEEERHSFMAVCGHNAIILSKFVHPNMQAATVLRDPIDRVVSHYRFCRTHSREFLHPICRTRSLAQCCREIPQFQNYYASNFNPNAYRIVAFSPESLLRTIGYSGDVERINRSNQYEVTDEDLEAADEANREDTRIYVEMQQRAASSPGSRSILVTNL